MAFNLPAKLTLALIESLNEGVSYSTMIMPNRTKVTPTKHPVFISFTGRFIIPY